MQKERRHDQTDNGQREPPKPRKQPKVYGRTARIIAIKTEIESGRLPDICIDMMYSVMLTF